MAAGARAPAAGGSGGHWIDWRERRDRPLYSVALWPNRSLSPAGQRRVIALTATGFALPLAGSVATPVFWGLLPFCGAALGILWAAFLRCNHDGRLIEELTLWRDEVRVERREPKGRIFRWTANPHFVVLRIHPDGRVRNYLTLKGGGREIELGAFLSPGERADLKAEIEGALAAAR